MSKPLEVRLEDRLRTMKDKTFLYNSYPVKVLSYKFDGEYCTVVTSGPWVTRPNVQLLKVLDEFLETDEETLPAVVSQNVEYERPKVEMLGSFKQLTDILMENIKKVQEDKGYVDQAQQVSQSVKMIVELAKTEIEAVKAVNEIVRNR
ncbi:hypothetical protein [Spirosoma spitsbergense]|uniref:hypothetical protein n=1 Tax=Spirosoma spitsbergense TaxID=431554 RepID=UPI0012FC105C|nr:hypothetical protein [Spirosoma spitsbergense]